MKILHLSSEATWRGGEQQIAYLIEELETLGIAPLVACKPGSEFEKYCVRKGWRYESLPMRSSSDVKSGWGLKKLCKKHSVDLVHAHSSHSHSTSFLSYFLGNKTPVILTRRVDFELKSNFFSRYKYTFTKIRKIVCVSDAIRKIVVEGTGQPERCMTIYSSIDHSKFEPYVCGDFLREEYDLDADLTLVGNTSALAPHKDYATFVRTAEHYIRNYDEKVRFFVIGSGEQEDEIKAHVSGLGLADYFIFTGFLKNIGEVLPSLDFFLITSKTEGLGTSVIDAFASKVPVVATEAGGIPELVKHEETGLTAKVGDFEHLSAHLNALKMDDELRRKMTDGAFQHSQKFNTKTMARHYHKLYGQALAGKGDES
ncbi:MAG: glycosyltransferase family 4 protein [Akkermansiaceae bacterium]|nr:glycosyltransferase family 4 protein [Akkermansiaceae bacterium]